jgi:hypothetical protein
VGVLRPNVARLALPMRTTYSTPKSGGGLYLRSHSRVAVQHSDEEEEAGGSDDDAAGESDKKDYMVGYISSGQMDILLWPRHVTHL